VLSSLIGRGPGNRQKIYDSPFKGLSLCFGTKNKDLVTVDKELVLQNLGYRLLKMRFEDSMF